jgi:adenylosuccinate synthase
MHNNVKAVIGGQWGDEGKGKIVDFLSSDADYCVRFQGGSNAGHTIIYEGETFKLRLLPSGVLQGAEVILGAGMVINLDVLCSEVQEVEQRLNISLEGSIHIDSRAHLVLPAHIYYDVQREEASGNRIGTTRNGIGLCYEDKARRVGIRAGDLLDTGELPYCVETFLRSYDEDTPFQIRKLLDILEEWADQWRGYIRTDMTPFLHGIFQEGKKVVIEGAQGTLLDVSHGTYPYVTSSHTIAPSIGASLGCALPRDMETIGVFKAYCTRVGSGDFISEDLGEDGDRLQAIGKEVGVVTARKRRCGWLNLDDLIYAHQLNGFTHIALTKVDVLDGFEKVKVWHKDQMHELEGWDGSAEAKSWKELPESLQWFISFIEDNSGVSVTMVSNGADRENTLLKEVSNED